MMLFIFNICCLIINANAKGYINETNDIIITSVANEHLTSTALGMSTLQIPSKHKEITEFGIIAIVIIGLPTVSLAVLVLFLIRKCLTVQDCQTTTQNIRRNNINIHQMVQKYGNCEKRTVNDGYSDPWDIRHKFVQQGEHQQQNTIMEETET